MSDTRVCLVTTPDRAVAERLVRALVTERLAACGNILADCRSIYRWQGVIEESAEVLVILKTAAAAVDRLLARVPELHPYDVPEVLVLPVEAGLAAYVEWVVQSVSHDGENEAE